METLTPREREILQLISEGHTPQQVAQKLGIALETVESHRQQLMERLNIGDVADVVQVRYMSGGGPAAPE